MSVLYSASDPSHQWMRSASVCRATSATQSARALLLVIWDPSSIVAGRGTPHGGPPGWNAYYIASADCRTPSRSLAGRGARMRRTSTTTRRGAHGGAHDPGDPETP